MALTDGPVTPIPTDSEFTDEWHMINQLTRTECRQLSDDTFQLRNASHTLTVNKEGFDLYRSDTPAFEKWMDDNSIVATPRNTKFDKDYWNDKP